jgi:hypothetical protein
LLLCAVLVFSGAVAAEDTELEQIRRHIAQKGYDWVAGPTSVSALSPEERQALRGLRLPEDWVEPQGAPVPAGMQFPSRFDWREMGGVSPVKNQSVCGSCYAFAPIAALESQVMIYQGFTPDLSEQQVVSCNTKGYDCSGGWFDVNDDLRDHGAVDESCMPYRARNMACADQGCEIVARISSWNWITNSVESIKAALQNGPVAVALTALNDLDYYRSGCYQSDTTQAVNHAVLIVGWDDAACGGDGGWIAKNSWGTGWGDNGFFIIRYGNCRIGVGAHQIFIDAGPPPTPTPPLEDLALDITTYTDYFVAGQVFQLDIIVQNNTGVDQVTDLFVVLEAWGEYYFWPRWTQTMTSRRRSYYPGENWEQLLNFVWPAGTGRGQGLVFHAALCTPGTLEVLSYDSCTFS